MLDVYRRKHTTRRIIIRCNSYPVSQSVPRSVTQAQSSHNGVKYFMKLHSNFEATKNDHEKEKASEVISQPPLGIVLQRIDSKFKCCPLPSDRIQVRIGFFLYKR